jgi:hypothetical protein
MTEIPAYPGQPVHIGKNPPERVPNWDEPICRMLSDGSIRVECMTPESLEKFIDWAKTATGWTIPAEWLNEKQTEWVTAKVRGLNWYGHSYHFIIRVKEIV